MKSFKESLNEASLSRVYQHTKGTNIGMISAHSDRNTPEENKANHERLAQDIRKAGFGHVNVHGKYIMNKGEPNEHAVTEKSYLVIGKKGDDSGNLKGFLKKHGEKYGQESVLHKAHDEEDAKLHYTGGTQKGQIVNAGKFHPNRAADYQSAMRGGKTTFTFESVEYRVPKSFFFRNEELF